MTTPPVSANPFHLTEELWRNNLRGNLDAELAGPRPSWWWTGHIPRDCPGRRSDGTITSLALPDLANCTRAQALDYFDNG